MVPLNILTFQKWRIKLRRCKANAIKVLCGTVSAFADNPVLTPEYLDFTGISAFLATCTTEEVLYTCTHVIKLHFFYLEASISLWAPFQQKGCLLVSVTKRNNRCYELYFDHS